MPGSSVPLADRLRREIRGDVHFDPYTRGRYSTDGSIYQIEPTGVVLPRSEAEIGRVLAIARDVGVPVTPRGAGTSQAGQTVGEGLVVDTSRHLTRILDFDPEARTATVEPGLVLDRLNAFLRPHGLHFPVDVATSSRATIGGMAGNNSAGSRSIRYGIFADNVLRIRARLADGTDAWFGPAQRALPASTPPHAREDAAAARLDRLAHRIRSLHEREADELERRVPKVLRHVAGYNLHRLDGATPNLAELLVGSEGTLAFFTAITLKLAPLPEHRVLGVCSFPSLVAALDAVQHIVTLDPSAVELLDRTVIGQARDSRQYADDVARFVHGEPGALLLVEFAGAEPAAQRRGLDRLEALLGDLGHPGAVLRAEDPALQATVWEVRKAGLNLLSAVKGDVKSIAVIEDCAIPLDRLAEWGERLTDVVASHGVEAPMYAHASVGCLHVRPMLNLKRGEGVATMRAIAEDVFAIATELGGSHSGEHGDGIIRGEFIRSILGDRLARAFAEVKETFDPDGLLNPGRIVDPPRMDDRSLMRYTPDYGPIPLETGLDWSEWGGFHRATEMCNNNGACRKFEPGVMCPSYRATLDEQHATRGRANTLRLALTGQLPEGALTSDSLYQTLALCVGCKGCRRECPTGVDMARMKTEFLYHYHARHGPGLRDRLVAWLPRYAPWAARLAPLVNLRNRSRLLRRLGQTLTGFAADRTLPAWRRDVFRADEAAATAAGRGAADATAGPTGAASGGSPGGRSGGEGSRRRRVLLFADTFTTYFEPEIARAALRVLAAAGYQVTVAEAPGGGRRLCCGRTFLNVGLIDEARREARRLLDALRPAVEAGVPIVGLEPSCLLTLRDELGALLPGDEADALAERAVLFEELLLAEREAGRLELEPHALPTDRVRVHGHCHQKAFGVDDTVPELLRWIPDLEVEPIASGCCGMAGSFGYHAEHHAVSLRMAELELAPALREEPAGSWIVADGTSCRHQIRDTTGREALHAAVVLDRALRARE